MQLEKKLNSIQRNKLKMAICTALELSKAQNFKISKSEYINLLNNTVSDENLLKMYHDLEENYYALMIQVLDIKVITEQRNNEYEGDYNDN